MKRPEATIKSWYSAAQEGWLAVTEFDGETLQTGKATPFEWQAIQTVKDAVDRRHWAKRGPTETQYTPSDKQEHGW